MPQFDRLQKILNTAGENSIQTVLERLFSNWYHVPVRRIIASSKRNAYRVACAAGCGMSPLRPPERHFIKQLDRKPVTCGTRIWEIEGERDIMYSTCETIRLDYEKISQNWEQILISLFRLSDSFSVITMAPHPYSEHIECVHDPLLEPLIPYLLSQKIGIRKWPGTENRDIHKVMNKYRTCAKSRNLLHTLGNVFKADLL